MRQAVRNGSMTVTQASHAKGHLHCRLYQHRDKRGSTRHRHKPTSTGHNSYTPARRTDTATKRDAGTSGRRNRRASTAKQPLLDRCCFCGVEAERELELGKFHIVSGLAVHYYCLLFSSGLPQNGEDEEGIMGFMPQDIELELARGRKLLCVYCRRPGATIGCLEKKCRKSYHFPCGLEHYSLFRFTDNFSSHCAKHRQYQQGKGQGRVVECPICMEELVADPRQALWAPCCNRDSWFHKYCLQRLALSAGYFFKCPLCNDKEKFVNEMVNMGIYIPEKDASWELEPNAYSELERPVCCDAPKCKCPEGRKTDDAGTWWEVLLCSLCGSSGVHVACGGLPFSATEWTCPGCAQMVSHSVKRMEQEMRERRVRERQKRLLGLERAAGHTEQKSRVSSQQEQVGAEQEARVTRSQKECAARQEQEANDQQEIQQPEPSDSTLVRAAADTVTPSKRKLELSEVWDGTPPKQMCVRETAYGEVELELEHYPVAPNTVIRLLEEQGEELPQQLLDLRAWALRAQERMHELRLTEVDIVRMAKDSTKYKTFPLDKSDISRFYRYNLPLVKMIQLVKLIRAVFALREAMVTEVQSCSSRSTTPGRKGKTKRRQGVTPIKIPILKSALDQTLVAAGLASDSTVQDLQCGGTHSGVAVAAASAEPDICASSVMGANCHSQDDMEVNGITDKTLPSGPPIQIDNTIDKDNVGTSPSQINVAEEDVTVQQNITTSHLPACLEDCVIVEENSATSLQESAADKENAAEDPVSFREKEQRVEEVCQEMNQTEGSGSGEECNKPPATPDCERPPEGAVFHAAASHYLPSPHTSLFTCAKPRGMWQCPCCPVQQQAVSSHCNRDRTGGGSVATSHFCSSLQNYSSISAVTKKSMSSECMLHPCATHPTSNSAILPCPTVISDDNSAVETTQDYIDISVFSNTDESTDNNSLFGSLTKHSNNSTTARECCTSPMLVPTKPELNSTTPDDLFHNPSSFSLPHSSIVVCTKNHKHLWVNYNNLRNLQVTIKNNTLKSSGSFAEGHPSLFKKICIQNTDKKEAAVMVAVNNEPSSSLQNEVTEASDVKEEAESCSSMHKKLKQNTTVSTCSTGGEQERHSSTPHFVDQAQGLGTDTLESLRKKLKKHKEYIMALNVCQWGMYMTSRKNGPRCGRTRGSSREKHCTNVDCAQADNTVCGHRPSTSGRGQQAGEVVCRACVVVLQRLPALKHQHRVKLARGTIRKDQLAKRSLRVHSQHKKQHA